MNSKFYKMRRNRMISGVLAGLSENAKLQSTNDYVTGHFG